VRRLTSLRGCRRLAIATPACAGSKRPRFTALAHARVDPAVGPGLATSNVVICRIQVNQSPTTCTIRVAGRLTIAYVDHLVAECARASGATRIDLTDLLSADQASLIALRRLADSGAELAGIAQYLRFELEALP
jgi:hypothetical protein